METSSPDKTSEGGTKTTQGSSSSSSTGSQSGHNSPVKSTSSVSEPSQSTLVVVSSGPQLAPNITLSMASTNTSMVAAANAVSVSMAQQGQPLQYVQVVNPMFQTNPQFVQGIQPGYVFTPQFQNMFQMSNTTIPIMPQSTAQQTAVPISRTGRPQLGQLPIRPTPTPNSQPRSQTPTIVANTVTLGNQQYIALKNQKNHLQLQPRPPLATINPTSGQIIRHAGAIIPQSYMPPVLQTVQAFNPNQFTYAQGPFINHINPIQYVPQTIPIVNHNLTMATQQGPTSAGNVISGPTPSAGPVTVTPVSQVAPTTTSTTVTKLKPVAPRPPSSVTSVSSTSNSSQPPVTPPSKSMSSSNAKSKVSPTKNAPATAQKVEGGKSTSTTGKVSSSSHVKPSSTSELKQDVNMPAKTTSSAFSIKTSTPVSKLATSQHPTPSLSSVRKDMSKNVQKGRETTAPKEVNGTSPAGRSNILPHKPGQPINLRNGHANQPVTPINRSNRVKIDKSPSDVLVHVIEDFVIEESSKPFPIEGSPDSSVKENGGWTNHATPEVTRKRPSTSDQTLSEECQICLNLTPKSRLKPKNGLRVCPSCASKKVPSTNSSQLGIFNPVTSKEKVSSEYDFNEPKETVDQAPMSKKPRLSKGPRPTSTTNLQQSKMEATLEAVPAVNGTTPSTPTSDPLSGLFFPKSGRNPEKWNVQDVFDFVRHLEGCEDAANQLKEQEIDGTALMLLQQDHMMKNMSMKLGPALKISKKIDELKVAFGGT